MAPRSRVAVDSETFEEQASDALAARDPEACSRVAHAYEGELDYQYTEEGNVLRVTWVRDASQGD